MFRISRIIMQVTSLVVKLENRPCNVINLYVSKPLCMGIHFTTCCYVCHYTCIGTPQVEVDHDRTCSSVLTV